MVSFLRDKVSFDSLAEEITYKKLKTLEHELNAIIINHPKIKRGLIGNYTGDLAVIHGTFGVILCEVKGIRNKDLPFISSIENGKIIFSTGKQICDPWEQITKYRNTLIERLNKKYYISKKVILPYVSSHKFKKYFPELYKLYQNDTLFKDDVENSNFEKLFLGIPTDVSLSPEDIRYLCEVLGVKINEDKLNNISVYKITTPTGIFYYDKKVISVLKEYRSGLKIIRGLAGTGKTITLLQFILYKASELRYEFKKVGIFCFNKPLYEYIKSWLKKFNLLDLVEIRRINKKQKSKNYFPDNKFKYVLIDEFQDFPDDIGYYIVSKHKNVIIFVDETQKIYDEGFTSWKKVLKEKFNPGLLNNYLRIVYRNPTDIYKCGLELLTQDREIKGYTKVQEIINESKSINEIGGLTFYENIFDLIKEMKLAIKKIKNNTGYVPKIGLLINGTETDELEKKKRYSYHFENLDFDVKSYLRVKGLEYDFVILTDFWDFLSYYKAKFSYLYRMTYTIISRGKFGVFIPRPSSLNNSDLINVYNILQKHSKEIIYKELLNEVCMSFDKKTDNTGNNSKLKFNIPINLAKLTYTSIEIIANIRTIIGV